MLEQLITDWAVRGPRGEVLSCAGRDVALEQHDQAPHMTVICRLPGGTWYTQAEMAALLRAEVNELECPARPGAHRFVVHGSGLRFQVIAADSFDARMARDRRELTMADGSVWTVGTRGRGSALAWQPAPTA